MRCQQIPPAQVSEPLEYRWVLKCIRHYAQGKQRITLNHLPVAELVISGNHAA